MQLLTTLRFPIPSFSEPNTQMLLGDAKVREHWLGKLVAGSVHRLQVEW